jgi:hypothetical protein
VSLKEVRRNFERYGLLDDRVQFLVGWFEDTLPTATIERLAVLRLDGDMYSSTHHVLSALYPRLSVGGYVIVDDYYLDTCRAAITDYRAQHAKTTTSSTSTARACTGVDRPQGDRPDRFRASQHYGLRRSALDRWNSAQPLPRC